MKEESLDCTVMAECFGVCIAATLAQHRTISELEGQEQELDIVVGIPC